MSTKTVSFVLGQTYDRLISQEVENGNFQSKSEFLRYLVRNWFDKNTQNHQEESK